MQKHMITRITRLLQTFTLEMYLWLFLPAINSYLEAWSLLVPAAWNDLVKENSTAHCFFVLSACVLVGLSNNFFYRMTSTQTTIYDLVDGEKVWLKQDSSLGPLAFQTGVFVPDHLTTACTTGQHAVGVQWARHQQAENEFEMFKISCGGEKKKKQKNKIFFRGGKRRFDRKSHSWQILVKWQYMMCSDKRYINPFSCDRKIW